MGKILAGVLLGAIAAGVVGELLLLGLRRIPKEWESPKKLGS
jgi:hypothetical protein